MGKKLAIAVLVFLVIVVAYIFAAQEFRLLQPGNMFIVPSVMLAAFAVYFLSAAAKLPGATIEEKVENLEKSLSRLRGAFVAVLLLALLAVNTTVGYLFRSGEFQISRLETQMIAVVTKDGNYRVVIGEDAETTTLRMRDKNGRDRIKLLVTADGIAALGFLDADEKVRASLGVAKDGPEFNLLKADGKPLLVAGTTDGQGDMRVGDDQGRTRVQLGGKKDDPALQIYDKEGKPIFTKP